MHYILAIFFGTILTLVLGDVPYPRLNLAPTERRPEHFTEPGLAVFDLQVNAAGHVVDESLLLGRPPYIERAREAFNSWQFEERSGADAHVNATVIYQPRLGLPAQPNPMNVPFPNTGKENFTSPFPLHVVMPAFPLEGMAGGTVVMQAALEADGTVRSIQVLSGPPSLLESAVASLKTWQFYVPDKLDAASRTAVVVAYFQSPEFGTSMSDNPAEILAEATLTRGTSPGVPVGAHGNLAAGTSNLSFRYADSHWVIPYSLITNIRYSVIPDSEDHLMTITYSGVDSEQTIFFRVKGDAGLSAASVVSSRSGRVIDFGKVIS